MFESPPSLWLQDSIPSTDSYEGKDNDEDETSVKGSKKGGAVDDEALEGDEATSYAEATEDVFTPAQGVDLGKQSTTIHRLCTNKIALKRRNISRVDKINSEDGTPNA
ncbi:hypothetical protein PVK06_001995 [Gossypium arboreum]|uniref:Uncharacterized protein n=1 Tax=Gossypium arboreum TaxID=29729 RepID=A0ABR0R2G4_GOSAR|nr:hypothetical protein PVK06_001995 [Gossypium arboreum]